MAARDERRSQRVAITTGSMGKNAKDLFERLMAYSDRYMINLQLWPDYYTIYIEKDSVDLYSYGSYDVVETMTKALEYLDRINRKL